MAFNPLLQTLFNNFVEGAVLNDLYAAGDLYSYADLYLFANTISGLVDYDLYTITLASGIVLRFTTADFNILPSDPYSSPLITGQTYLSTGVRVDERASKVAAHWKIGLDTDTWTVVFMPRAVDYVTGAAFPDTVGSVPFIQAAHSGYFDAADFQVDRAYFAFPPAWPMPPAGRAPVSCKTIFAGTVAECDTTTSSVVMRINDYRSLMDYQMPRHVYFAQCRHTLFDIDCNASGNMLPASFAVNGVCAPGCTFETVIAQGLAKPLGSGTYALGMIVMTSGNNDTVSTTIVGWDGAQTLKLMEPLPYAPQSGDTFQVFPGCDKQITTCTAFNNLANYGGQPNIPPPETAI
jgi:hypothetical protein